jgi:lipopolysaccharide transport system ATP-binding protein
MAAIVLDHVSKKFTLRHDRPHSFQEVFLNGLKHRGSTDSEQFWVLQDVDLEIQPGETVGIIGSNGAGKSTILKLVSRIIEPTLGRVTVNGRVGALLELGAGFHPDLTGEENIYLNGSIMGLSRAQIRQRMEEIVAFAELERFVDVPVKHYSSGMYVRLGFAVAVHTDPQVLLVDEVLAVGDASFQRKCLEKIEQMRDHGVTILLVSHNLGQVQHLCTRLAWLNGGRLEAVGPAAEVIEKYMGTVADQAGVGLAARNVRTRADQNHGKLRILDVVMVSDKPKWTFRTGDAVRVLIRYDAAQRIENPVFSILIHRSDGLYVSSSNTYSIDPTQIGPIQGQGEVVVEISRLDLFEGDYLLSVGAYVEPDPPYWASPAEFQDKAYRFQMYSANGAHGVAAMQARWIHRPDGEVGSS